MGKLENQPESYSKDSNSSILERPDKLTVFEKSSNDLINQIIKSLKEDEVTLVKDLKPIEANEIIYKVTEELGLAHALEKQANFASMQGHREKIGQYFMTVNKRMDYQFIPPHSEGNRSMNMHLSSFYCYENTTDGGESILMNVNQSSLVWKSLKEVVLKVSLGSWQPTLEESKAIKISYGISIPDDIVKDSDHILRTSDTHIPGVKLYHVLEKVSKVYSKILQDNVYVYWDSMASTDYSSAKEFLQLLRAMNLLKEPEGGLSDDRLDNAIDRRLWHSGVKYIDLFSCKVTRKLHRGELIIQNNLTWTHSANNWTPGSGIRKVVGAFA